MGLANFFDARFKLWDHLAQFALISIAIALTAIHMNAGVIYARAEIMTIAMGAKSFVLLGYQLLTEHIERFRRWESQLANMIINALELLFWLVVVVLKIQSVQRFCEGIGCPMSTGVIIVVWILLFFNVHVAVISILDYRYYKTYRVPRGQSKKSLGHSMS